MKPLTHEEIRKRASRHKKRVDFKKGDDSAYKSALRHGLMNELFPKIEKIKKPKIEKIKKPEIVRERRRRLLTDEVVTEIAKKYRTRAQFENADKSASNYARREGLIDELFPERKYSAKTTSDFIKTATCIHGDRYDYSEVSYERGREKVKIKCRHHGEFWQRPESHMAGRGCAKCWSYDNNAFYIKLAIGMYFNGEKVYKVGVTSMRRGVSRLEQQSRNSKMKHVTILPPTELVGKASDVEIFALSLGYNPKLIGFDGCTEYRAYSDKELSEIKSMVDLCRV